MGILKIKCVCNKILCEVKWNEILMQLNKINREWFGKYETIYENESKFDNTRSDTIFSGCYI